MYADTSNTSHQQQQRHAEPQIHSAAAPSASSALSSTNTFVNYPPPPPTTTAFPPHPPPHSSLLAPPSSSSPSSSSWLFSAGGGGNFGAGAASTISATATMTSPTITQTVKAMATEAVITGGLKRRQEQARQQRTRNRDNYVSAKRERGLNHVSSHHGGSDALPEAAAVFDGAHTSSMGQGLQSYTDHHQQHQQQQQQQQQPFHRSLPPPPPPRLDASPLSRAPTDVDFGLMVLDNGHSHDDDSIDAESHVEGAGGSKIRIAGAFAHQQHNSSNNGSSPLSQSLRFLNRFKLREKGNRSPLLFASSPSPSTALSSLRPPPLQQHHHQHQEEEEVASHLQQCYHDDASPLLPRLQSRAALRAVQRNQQQQQHDGEGDRADGVNAFFSSSTASASSSSFFLKSMEDTTMAQLQKRFSGLLKLEETHHQHTPQQRRQQHPRPPLHACLIEPAPLFSREVLLNLQALEGCLDALAQEAYSLTSSSSSLSDGCGREGEGGDGDCSSLSLLIEDLNTTLQSLFAARKYQQHQERQQRTRRRRGLEAVAAADGNSNNGVIHANNNNAWCQHQLAAQPSAGRAKMMSTPPPPLTMHPLAEVPSSASLTTNVVGVGDEEEGEDEDPILVSTVAALFSKFVVASSSSFPSSSSDRFPPTAVVVNEGRTGTIGVEKATTTTNGDTDPPSIIPYGCNSVGGGSVSAALQWQITHSASLLLRCDLPTPTMAMGSMPTTTTPPLTTLSDDKQIDAFIVSLGQWMGIATVTCLHALGNGDGDEVVEDYDDQDAAEGERIKTAEKRHHKQQKTAAITGLFTLLLRFSVGDFSPISQMWEAMGVVCGDATATSQRPPPSTTTTTPMLGIAAPATMPSSFSSFPTATTTTAIPLPTSSAYCRLLQEMSTEACATLLASPIFGQFINLITSVPAYDFNDDDAAANDRHHHTKPTCLSSMFERQDTESIGDVMTIEALLARPFITTSSSSSISLCPSLGGVGGGVMLNSSSTTTTTAAAAAVAQMGGAFGNLALHSSDSSMTPLFASSSSPPPPPPSTIYQSFLLRDAQENVALLLCILSASANHGNAEIVESLDKEALFGHQHHHRHQSRRHDHHNHHNKNRHRLRRILCVSPQLTAFAFNVFSDFLRVAIDDVGRASVYCSDHLHPNTNDASGAFPHQQQQQALAPAAALTAPPSSSPPSYFDPYTGTEYYTSTIAGGNHNNSSQQHHHHVAASSSHPYHHEESRHGGASGGGGLFKIDANVSLDSVMNALKGLGDLIAVSAVLQREVEKRDQMLRDHHQRQQQAPNTITSQAPHPRPQPLPTSSSSFDDQFNTAFCHIENTPPPAVTSSSNPRQGGGDGGGEETDERRKRRTVADDEFAAAEQRLDAINERRRGGRGGGGGSSSSAAQQKIAAIFTCYSQLRSEVWSKLTAPSSTATTKALSSSASSSGGEGGGGRGWDFFRPLLQQVPLCGRGGGGGGGKRNSMNATSTTADHYHQVSSQLPSPPPPSLPLLGADDDVLATAFRLAEGVISFYSSDPLLAASIPKEVMQYFYDHHGVLFRVAETFSPLSPSSPIHPPHSQSSNNNHHQHQHHNHYHHQHSPSAYQHCITPLLLRCRDALSSLYCAAPSLVFTHWDLFSTSILPFLSNTIDSFSRRNVLYIFAVLFKDPRYCNEALVTMMERPEFQEGLSAVMMGGGGGGGQQKEDSGRGVIEDDETDDVFSDAPTTHKATSQKMLPFTAEESDLLDIIISAVMGVEGEGLLGALSGEKKNSFSSHHSHGGIGEFGFGVMGDGGGGTFGPVRAAATPRLQTHAEENDEVFDEDGCFDLGNFSIV